MEKLSTNTLWLKGPSWLGTEKGAPVQGLPLPEECFVELSKKQTHSLLTAQNGASLSNIIEIANYSNLGHLLRVTAYVC